MFPRFFIPVAAAAVLLSAPIFAQPVFAQSGPDAGVQAPAAGNSAHAAQRLTQMHDRLGITPAQQPQWDALVAALRENSAAMRANPAVRAIHGGHLDAVQAVRAAADAARARADGLQRMVPAVEALYVVLSPEQQQTANQALDRMMHAGPHRRG